MTKVEALKKEKKILFLVQLPPPVHGAALRNQFIAKSALLNKSFSIKVLPLKFAKNVSDIEKLTIRKIIKMILFSFVLVYYLIAFKPKLVYFTLAPTGKTFYRDVFFVLLIKLSRIKIVYHLRVLGVKNYKGRVRNKLYKYVFKNTSVICLSKTASRDIDKVHIGEKFIVNNGIEDPISQYNLSLNRNNSDNVKRIMFLSNFFISKGVLEIIDSAELLSKKRSDFHIYLIGNETAELSYEYLNKIIRDKNLTEFVTIKKGLYKRDKFIEYLKSDIFLFPTFYPKENFPGVILEAMSCQLPIITTNIASITEIIDDGINGLIINQKDTKQLAEQIEKLLEDDNLRINLGRTARVKYTKRYLADKFESNMLRCFNELTR